MVEIEDNLLVTNVCNNKLTNIVSVLLIKTVFWSKWVFSNHPNVSLVSWFPNSQYKFFESPKICFILLSLHNHFKTTGPFAPHVFQRLRNALSLWGSTNALIVTIRHFPGLLIYVQCASQTETKSFTTAIHYIVLVRIKVTVLRVTCSSNSKNKKNLKC